MFAERLKKVRQANKDTQLSLGQKLGLSKYAIAMWEQEKAAPTLEMFAAICKLYNVSADYLLGLTNNENVRKYVIDDTQQIIESLKQYINSLEDE